MLVTDGILDREFQPEYNITITATDAGSPSLSSVKVLTIMVNDINDNPPTFKQSKYDANILENQPVGTFVMKVNAEDIDDGSNSKILYQISRDTNSEVSSFLTINSETGELFTSRLFDYEQLVHFQIKVTARDGGDPPLSTTCTVNVLDINDHAPVFPNKDTPVRLEISESAVVGVQFPLQSAEDQDVGQNALQNYVLSPNDNFILKQHANPDGSKYVEMVLQKPLDREQHPHLSLKLIAVDGGTPQRSGTVNIDITVLDVNDNAPVFNQSMYKASVMENTMKGTSIVTVNATDADSGSNGLISYSLSKMKGSAANIFSIDEITGTISVAGQIDYEKDRKYEVRVEAKDQGGLTGTSKVILDVFDINDNAPVINIMSFSSPVSEDARPGTTIAVLNIKDADSEKNGQIKCSIDGKLPFKIDSSLTNYYNLISDQYFDRESVPEYNITITATDLGSPPLSSSTKLHLKISDVNDNPPLFDKNSYSAYITENNSPGVSIFAVSARDSDWNQNARISYLLEEIQVNGSPVSTYVSLNSETGVLNAVRSFDYEQIKQLQLIVKAQDGGSPPLSSNVSVKIMIQDQNDNPPQVLYPVQTGGSLLAEMVPRSADVGYLVTKVVAVDVDSGQNAWLSYKLQKATDRALFEHPNPDGSKHCEIVLQKPLDREQRPSLSLKLIAVDGGAPQRSGTVNIDITVLDANDNVPVFNQSVYKASVMENTMKGTSIVTVNATDADSGSNGLITYSLSQMKGSAADIFNIDEITGTISVAGQIDYEKDRKYELRVEAKDQGGLIGTSKLHLKISDVNDNPPLFDKNSYSSYITENNSPGVSIFAVSARDSDWNQNARISYLLEEIQVNGSPVSTYVSLNSKTGVLNAVRSFDYEQIKQVQLVVKAQDGGSPPLSSNVTVKLIIRDQNDNPPQVLYPVQTGGSLVAEMVPRSADVGYLVTKVVAVDVDSGQNAWLSYKLQKATDRALFEVGLQNGEIRTIRQVTDKDAVKQRLTVIVEDNGQPSRSATFTDFTHDKEYNDRLTFYLVLALAVVSFLFITCLVVIISVKIYRWRQSRILYHSNLPVIPYYPPRYSGTLGTGTLQHVYNYEVCRTTDSRKSDCNCIDREQLNTELSLSAPWTASQLFQQ
uniref:Cadherin domain-containing protein n=1 Tax=Dicentrarchus labrax TaxID=13489 RepID=A0A8P4KBI4_DICLA